jgi:hypothetical protein
MCSPQNTCLSFYLTKSHLVFAEFKIFTSTFQPMGVLFSLRNVRTIGCEGCMLENMYTIRLVSVVV